MAGLRSSGRRPPTCRAAAALQWLGLLLQALALTGLQPASLFGGMAIGLGVLTALKLWEARSLAEHRLVSLLQLVGIGLVAAQRPELASSLLQLAVTLLALAGLLALELGEGLGWRVLLRRSLQVLAAALPIALVLFLLVPRLAPFSTLPLQTGAGAVVGLSEQLDPGSIAELASQDAPAARVAFSSGAPPPLRDRYWRVVVHDRFDGRIWDRSTVPLRPQGDGRALAETPVTGGGATQLWVAAPSPIEAVPWGGGGRPRGRDLLLDPRGELLHRGPGDQRRVYGIAEPEAVAAWRRLPPDLNDLALPRGTNPRLEALGASWRQWPSAELRLQAAHHWFRSQPFRYTLRPGTLPDRAPLDAFLFDSRRGFCGHYASAFTALMRSAGVPARVVSGYRGGQWVVPVGGEGYLDLRQSDAHAWSEVWLPDQGWRAIDPTLWIAPEAFGETRPAGWGPSEWLRHQWWGLDIAWTRWWLGFDRAGQESLLRRLLGPLLPWLGAVVLLALALALVGSLTVLRLLQRRSLADPGRRQLELLLVLLARWGQEPDPGESLSCFARRAEQRLPSLAPELARFVELYQRLRFAPPSAADPVSPAQLRRLRRRLGRRLGRPPGGAPPGQAS